MKLTDFILGVAIAALFVPYAWLFRFTTDALFEMLHLSANFMVLMIVPCFGLYVWLWWEIIQGFARRKRPANA